MNDILSIESKQHPINKVLNSESFKTEISKVLNGISCEKMIRMALTDMRTNQKLACCTTESICSSLFVAAQLGLEPGSHRGHAWLIPYGSECKIMIGYKGLIELAYRSGKVSSISADCVEEDDDFTVISGSDTRLIHKPQYRGGEIRVVYAYAHMRDGGFHFSVISKKDIDALKKSSSQIWKDHWKEMAKKTAIRRLIKTLPLTTLEESILNVLEENKDIIDIEEKVVSAPSRAEVVLEEMTKEKDK